MDKETKENAAEASKEPYLHSESASDMEDDEDDEDDVHIEGSPRPHYCIPFSSPFVAAIDMLWRLPRASNGGMAALTNAQDKQQIGIELSQVGDAVVYRSKNSYVAKEEAAGGQLEVVSSCTPQHQGLKHDCEGSNQLKDQGQVGALILFCSFPLITSVLSGCVNIQTTQGCGSG